ncbi:hypothetical protein JAAARDRAFT_31816 [Jaapia argillacea MUCL 33604]|uniref:Uncharacterized protein n=1 Tax=Jaapia argillacea MUCL 33604 TaxID=933084 RepID=A0A067Q3W1_9AGAM|nr:hypothetical protein JAAARDRAFT_31816 [Jaapia argillacea MUCL 33604]
MLRSPLRRPPRLRPFLPTRTPHILRSYASHPPSSNPLPTQWKPDSSNEPSVLMDENYSKFTMFTVDFFRRLVKFSALGVLGLGVVTLSAFSGAHYWVESVGMAPEGDEEARKWEWDKEMDRWSAGDAGGTDPALGMKGRHAARSAWIVQNWGLGNSAPVLASKSGRGEGGLSVVEARLEYAQDFLSIALKLAEAKCKEGALSQESLATLLARHASILERMGTKNALFESRSQLERVWATLPGPGVDGARVAMKLGDLSKRLGDGEDALTWWAKAIQLTLPTSNQAEDLGPNPVVPTATPSSPSAQRTLASTLVSLSAYYATSGALRQAEAVEHSSLDLIRSIQQPASLASASPPQALHALFLLHRSALLSIHLAEVLYGLRKPAVSSIEWLTRAAESSERVALALTGLPSIHPDAPESLIPHPPSSETGLLATYANSRSMKRPASSLLRDSRRSAAEAWNLMGVLYEGFEGGESKAKALECYERALGWAGVAADRVGNIAEAGEGTLETEWKMLWGNYVRVRDAVRRESVQKK